MFKTKLLSTSFVLIVSSQSVFSQNSLIGFPNIIDGDTLTVGNKRVRLHGIDAPELKQSCIKNEVEFKCGYWAKIALKRKVGKEKIRCDPHGKDRYKRLIAVCYQNKLNLNYWMVKSGWALAYRRYSTAYLDAELSARNKKVGIWSSAFIVPSAWRKGDRLKKQRFSGHKFKECKIKGNISSSGSKIYHEPADRDYSKTKINEANGERWFCSPQAAQNAGWRRAKR